MRALGPVLHPDIHFDNVPGLSPRKFQNLAERSEHLLALGIDSVGERSGKWLLAGHCASHQKRSDPARCGDRIIVLETGYFNADSAAHEFSSRIIYATV